MEIKTNQIVVEQFSFETVFESDKEADNQISVQVHEVEPAGEDKSILNEGKIFKIELPFELNLPTFRVFGQISQIAQLIGYSGEANEIDEETLEKISAPLISYIRRLTYEVTEIAFDEPGIDLDFSRN